MREARLAVPLPALAPQPRHVEPRPWGTRLLQDPLAGICGFPFTFVWGHSSLVEKMLACSLRIFPLGLCFKLFLLSPRASQTGLRSLAG